MDPEARHRQLLLLGVALPAMRVPPRVEWRDELDDDLDFDGEADLEDDDLEDDESDEDDLDEESDEDDEDDLDDEDEDVELEVSPEAAARHRMLELLGVELRARRPSNPAPGDQVNSEAGMKKYGRPMGWTIVAGMRPMTKAQQDQFDALPVDQKRRFLEARRDPKVTPARAFKAATGSAPTKRAPAKAVAPTKRMTRREILSASPEELAQAVRDGRVSRREAAARLRADADSLALNFVWGGDKDRGKVERLRALADELETTPTKRAPAKKAPAKAAKKAASIAPSGAEPTDLDRRIARLYGSDKSLSEVARELGISASTVHTSLIRQGVQLRPRGGAVKKAAPAKSFDAADTLRRLRAAESREEAYKILGNATGPQLAELQREAGEVIYTPSARTIEDKRRMVVDALVGERLDAKAIKGDATLPYGPRPAANLTGADREAFLAWLRDNPGMSVAQWQAQRREAFNPSVLATRLQSLAAGEFDEAGIRRTLAGLSPGEIRRLGREFRGVGSSEPKPGTPVGEVVDWLVELLRRNRGARS